MKNLFVFYHRGDYDVGGLVRFLIKIFDLEKYRNILLDEYGFKVITSTDIDILGKSDDDFIQMLNNGDFPDSVVFGIHPYGLSLIYKISSESRIKNRLKSAGWLNDPHFLAHYIKDRGEIVQRYTKRYVPPFLNNIDYLITPSAVYFENLNISEYAYKIVDIFYFLDPEKFDVLKSFGYRERLDKIILSGSLGEGYTSRRHFNRLREESDGFYNIVDKLDHPGYKDNEHMTEMNYYRKLCEYKGAFVGHYDFPINFVLAKHIETLMCGCLSFFEPNILLQSQLGLKEFIHYIPCFKDGKMIEDPLFYKEWLESDEGEKIAKVGQEYAMEKFGLDQIRKMFEFFDKC